MSNTPAQDPATPASPSLLGLISEPRLSGYLLDADGDAQLALHRYEANARLSAAFLHLSGHVEVIVRNSMDLQMRVLSARRGWVDWLMEADLDSMSRANVARARRRVGKQGRVPVSHDAMITRLPFGFWMALVARRHHAGLWVPGLHRAFLQGAADLSARRSGVYKALERVARVRNRAAHHEPIYRLDLADERDNALALVGWVNPGARAWVEANESLTEQLSAGL